MGQTNPSTYLPLSSRHDSWSSSTGTATVSWNYPVHKPSHGTVHYDPQMNVSVSGGDQNVGSSVPHAAQSTMGMTTATHSHVLYSISVQHGYNPVEYGNYCYSYPQATNYSSVQQGANQHPVAAYQPPTSFQNSGSYIGPTSNTHYNAGGHQTVPGYGSNSYYYRNSVQQGANQHSSVAYQPLTSFQNSGSDIGPTSNTYYNAAGHQTMPGYGSNRYYYQNNTWNDGSSGNNCAQSYQNYSSSDTSALRSSTSAPANSLQYQQQYNQWPYYYNHSVPSASSNPVAGNSAAYNIAVNTPSGYFCPSSQPPPPGTTSWKSNSVASVEPPMQASTLNTCSMEDLSEPLLAEIIKRITRTSDLNSLSLVSKQLYTVEAEERGTIRVGCGLHPSTEALAALCSRFPNLWKVEINYSGWTSCQGKQLDNQGLLVLSSHCSSLTDLTLSFCSYINDSGLGYLAYCKKLMALRLNFAPAISSSGLLSVVVGCKSLSTFHLVDCMKVGSVEWLEYLGRAGSLEELVVKDCKGISQYDLLKFGPGWMKLQKFEFEINGSYWQSEPCDPSYDAHYPYKYDICCENLKDLRLAKIITKPEIGLRFLLGKCKALEKLCLDYVVGLNDVEMITLFQTCSNLRSISLRFMPLRCGISFRTPLTDDSLKALSLCCPMLQVVELTFTFCSSRWPTEIGFTQKGIVMLVQTCPIRVLMLNGASIFNDEGMKDISSTQFLETLELVDCKGVTDVGTSFLARAPCLTSLTLRKCKNVTDNGMAELVRSQKLESLTVKGCRLISLEAVQGAARSVHYSAELESHDSLKGMKLNGSR